jgi:hypothetical protein
MTRAVGWALLLAAGAGCEGRPGYDRFIPADGAARAHLETALAAWRDGRPTAPVESPDRPAVHLVDTHRKDGQRLKAFTVLGPAPGDFPRCYAVRLALAQPDEELRARFVVIGQDPVWVMRYEDFEMIAHWDHPMTTRPRATGRK